MIFRAAFYIYLKYVSREMIEDRQRNLYPFMISLLRAIHERVFENGRDSFLGGRDEKRGDKIIFP